MAKQTMCPIENALEAQNCFTADASHELRTPLTAMKTEVEVALRDKSMTLTDAKSLLSSNLEEIAKLESLSNALLKVARSQDKARNDFEELSLPEIITGAYEKIETLAKQKSITFSSKLDNPKIRGDSASLTELFVILFDNAVKYSPEKSKVAIALAKDKKHAIIQIKDHGIGIKASDIPHIFDRFYRADTSRSKEKINGYGLGLSIAKNIVELHRGKISVSSVAGHGSTFTIELPLV
jgi:signal transduction histidine kinase